jgi:aquaporin Z
MKRYIMELIGTFFLTLSIVLLGANGFGIGAMLLALVYIGAHISGAHYNPSFTLSTVLGRCLPLNIGLFYMLFQFIGALLALAGIYAFLGIAWIHPIAAEVSVWMLFAIELLLTFVFTLVFLAVSRTCHLRTNQIYGIAIGFTLTAIAFYGGLYNASVGLASLILDFAIKREINANFLWYLIIYILVPLAAGAIAYFMHEFLNAGCERACSDLCPCSAHESCKSSSCTHENCMHGRCSR